jgi:hypothetical protein
MQRRPRWYRPLSPPNAFQGFTHYIGSEHGQSDVRDRNDILAAFLQSHRSRGDLYFKSPIACANIQNLARLYIERLTKRFGDDDSPSRIDGGFHGRNNGKKMALPQPIPGRGSLAGVRRAFDLLADHPLLGREAEDGRRELFLSRGKFGYVAKYRWVPSDDVVLILAVRHQLEAGYQEE